MADGRGVVIVGAGAHARVVAEAIAPRQLAGYLCPAGDSGDVRLGPRLGGDERAADLTASGHAIAIGIGFVDAVGARRRAALLDDLLAVRDVDLLTVTHTRSIVSEGASLGAGAYVGAGAIVGVDVEVGTGAIVNTGAILDHDCRVGRNTHIAPGAVLSGGVSVGDDTLVGVGATVRQNVRIGARVVVGAGAVVVDDLPDDVTAVGVPARFGDVPEGGPG